MQVIRKNPCENCIACVTLHVKSKFRKKEIPILPITHPINKTAIDLRRSINRLNIFRDQNANDIHVLDGTVDSIIKDLQEAKGHIPKGLIEDEA